MWDKLEEPWQACFELGWTSFKKGSIPIGAVVVDVKGKIIARGRNRLYESEREAGEIAGHKLSHAELNALLKVNESDYPNIRQFSLYSTTEPCPLCFGALVMANVRNLKFAARDRYAGGTNLNNKNKYIAGKNIHIAGPFPDLEKVQITLHTAYELIKGHHSERIFEAWKIDCLEAVESGIKLFRDKTLQKLKEKDAPVSEVFELIGAIHNINL
ncbi:MAG TPA: nucleoside deaminase [Firmicutes bacterium]|uniref:Nucleoside deaminase n=1 Tax=Capillibacterium thermochitinicola TaxID=2699427 RepID=A0A8J6I0A7_9FIRM|nr:nucleoside deaminase [Capillibacterium thermochitinicola]MBA2132608.1 nucleoside deaminase [Capillibacterium thermochitinicola]HHW12385.1 nucleoside deaminase [Bacillota bacterium]